MRPLLAAFLLTSAALFVPALATPVDAYCVQSVCAPTCTTCPVLLATVVNSHCEASTDVQQTDATCSLGGGPAFIDESHALPVGPGPSVWVEAGPQGHVDYGYATP